MTITAEKIGSFRWRILALLFMATTINYIDRSILGVLGPTLRDKVFGWSVHDYANITVSFQVAYAIGLLSMGGIIDKLGTKKGFTLSIAICGSANTTGTPGTLGTVTYHAITWPHSSTGLPNFAAEEHH